MIVIAVKTNLLKIYFERINGNKLVSKYLKKVINDINFDKHLNLILKCIHERSFDFIEINKKFYQDKLDENTNN